MLTPSDVKEFLTFLAVSRSCWGTATSAPPMIYTHTLKSTTIKEKKSPLDF
ncbi:MAG: hypothetical protein WC001_11800 [Desulfurivibrionaceae bacterium]